MLSKSTPANLPYRLLFPLLAGAAFLSACVWSDEEAPLSSAYDGYWQQADPRAEYGTFLKIRGGEGYYCVLDDKSSFFFEVRGKSINTPFNGRNAVDLDADGRLAITGAEKGEVYTTRFRRIPAVEYPSACREQEEIWK